MSTREHTALVKECLEDLALMGYAAWPNNTGAGEMHGRFIRFGKYGSGDIVVLLPKVIAGRIYGLHGEIECKTGEAIQKKHQKTHMRVVRKNGGVYLVVRDKDDLPVELGALGFPPVNPAYRVSSGPVLLL